jgi:LPS sulfotransferase NodH
VGEPVQDPLNRASIPVPSSTKVTTSCIIAALPRSGSWLLAEALNNTGLAGQPEEYFRPDFTLLWSDRWKLPKGASYRRYIEAATHFSTTPNGVFGVKLHWYQFAWFLQQMRLLEGEDDSRSDPELVAKWLPDPRYILLLRRDKQRQAISYYRAAKSQVWFVTDDSRPPPSADDDEEEPDFQTIRWLEDALVEHESCWRHFFERHEIEPLEIVYEDFVAEYDKTVLAVLDWLGIALPADFEVEPPSLVKQAGERTERLLAQYLEARETLSPMPANTVWSREMRRYIAPEESSS